MRVHAVTSHEGGQYVSRCVGAEVVAQGRTADEAEANLVEALARSGVPVAAASDPPRLTVLEAGSPDAPPMPEVEGSALVTYLAAAGWVVEETTTGVCARGPRDVAVAFPLGERVAPGVYRIVAVALPQREHAADDRAEWLAGLKSVFAQYPHTDDATHVIREQRDAR